MNSLKVIQPITNRWANDKNPMRLFLLFGKNRETMLIVEGKSFIIANTSVTVNWSRFQTPTQNTQFNKSTIHHFAKYKRLAAALTAIKSRLICNSNHRLIFNAMNVNLCRACQRLLTVWVTADRRGMKCTCSARVNNRLNPKSCLLKTICLFLLRIQR